MRNNIEIRKNKACPARLWRSGGFSLIETLLVVGILAIVFVISAPFTISFYRNQLVEDTRSNIIDTLQRAKHYAVLQKNDSAFGVTLSEVDDSYVLYQGSTYATRDNTQDEIFPVVEDMVFSGLTDVVFSKLTGLPSATGTISINLSNKIKEILVEDSGIISKIN